MVRKAHKKWLWIHEVFRVFNDRLVDENDRPLLLTCLHPILHGLMLLKAKAVPDGQEGTEK